ncbi:MULTISPECIES: hypothetical protein [unclassified Aeromicrobium]|uniref:hypothetical protein n=1 Tax=unclassified Aeromicrobium TaxID=2633570 RepID=UPI00288BC6A6|nr:MULTISPECIES: hypothetical protein [unclassified Aeromicrobium]
MAGARVTGLRETVRALEKYGAEASDLKDAFSAISSLVHRKAANRVRRATGALAASIRPSRTKNKAVLKAGGARLPYAVVQHWDPQRGNQYLSVPADESVPEALDLIAAELRAIARGLGFTT